MGFSFLSLLMFFFSLVAVALQYNDPDPLIWMPLYALTALWSWMSWAGRQLPTLLVGIFTLGCLLGALYLVKSFLDREWSIWQESLNESGGLFLAAVWSAALILRQRIKIKGMSVS